MRTKEEDLGQNAHKNPRTAARELLWLLRPSTCSLAYALFLASNASIIWGGSFPFLPLEFQTKDITTSFFFFQALAFSGCLALSLGGLLVRKPGESLNRLFTTVISAVPYFFGWVFLIAAMYLEDYQNACTVAGGALIGAGAAGYMLAWVRLFATKSRRDSATISTQGMLYTPFVYWALTLCPQAITAFMMPLIFMPLFTLSLMLETRDADFSASFFQQTPSAQPDKYKRAAADYWRLALCIATFGFACGVMRSLVLNEASAGSAVNNMSMAGALVSAILLFWFWNYRTARFNVAAFYRLIFPVLVIGFFLLPFTEAVLPASYPIFFAGFLYAVYTAAFSLVLIQCNQAAHARDIHPVFLFCVLGGITYLMHDFGFITGQFAEHLLIPGAGTFASVALITIALMSLMYYVGQGGWRAAMSPNRMQVEHIELIMSAHSPETRKRASAGTVGGQQPSIVDKTSKACRVVAERYALSDREAEVMELIARGHTVNRIAEELLISANTVRTHSKRLYAKLDIHKKQELRDLVDSFTPRQ